MTAQELIHKLQTEYSPDEKIVYTLWSWRDLEDVMENYSEDSAKELWEKIQYKFSRELEGFNPDIMDALRWRADSE